jgi:predicted RNA-binding protein with RPS1 domain
LNKYSSYELDLFINDLLDLFSESDKNLEKIISEDSKNRIKLHIKNSNFNEKFNKLIKNLDLVNDAFKNTNNETQKFYIVKYFLD